MASVASVVGVAGVVAVAVLQSRNFMPTGTFTVARGGGNYIY
jgi:hypothetical protein